MAGFTIAAIFFAVAQPSRQQEVPISWDDSTTVPELQVNNALTRPFLKFTDNGSFQISIFEDLHFGENAWEGWGPEQDRKSVKVMNAVLDSDRPDLVVLNGDLITGENAFRENATVYIDQIVGPMVQRNLPWASTYGNHDYQYNISGRAILEREQRYPLSLTTDMVGDQDTGVSNYYLPVYKSGTDTKCGQRSSGPTDITGECVPELLLWFFDSRGGFIYNHKRKNGNLIGHENWVHPKVVAWFRSTHDSLTARYGRVIPSLAFTHIPIKAALSLQKEPEADADANSIDPNLSPGNNRESVSEQAEGWCPNGKNSGNCEYGGQDQWFMSALVEKPGVMALFFGHDHGNTWCKKWVGQVPGLPLSGNGINLCYGQHSGYGGYGELIRGARQVLVTQEMLKDLEIDTWVRLETGEVVGSVSLNSTYGKDLYPAIPYRKSPKEGD